MSEKIDSKSTQTEVKAPEGHLSGGEIKSMAQPLAESHHEAISRQNKAFKTHLKGKGKAHAYEHSERGKEIPDFAPIERNIKHRAAHHITDNPDVIEIGEKMGEGLLSINDAYRAYKHTPHAPTSLLLKYAVHRVNHLNDYNDVDKAANLDKEFKNLHRQGKAHAKNGHVSMEDLHGWLSKNKEIIPSLLAHKENLHRLLQQGIGPNIRDINGEPHIALSRGIEGHIMNREHSLSSWTDNNLRAEDFGTRHSAWIPLKDLWYSYDLGHKFTHGTLGPEDEFLISHTGPRYEADPDDVKRLHKHIKKHGTAKDLPAFAFKNSSDENLAKEVPLSGRAVTAYLDHDGAGPATLSAALGRLNLAEPPSDWLSKKAVPREYILSKHNQIQASRNENSANQFYFSALDNPNLTTQDLKHIINTGHPEDLAQADFIRHPSMTQDLVRDLWNKMPDAVDIRHHIVPNDILEAEYAKHIQNPRPRIAGSRGIEHQILSNPNISQSLSDRILSDSQFKLPSGDKGNFSLEAINKVSGKHFHNGYVEDNRHASEETLNSLLDNDRAEPYAFTARHSLYPLPESTQLRLISKLPVSDLNDFAKQSNLAPSAIKALAMSDSQLVRDTLFRNKTIAPEQLAEAYPKGVAWPSEQAIKEASFEPKPAMLTHLAMAILQRKAYQERMNKEHVIRPFPENLYKSEDPLWEVKLAGWLGGLEPKANIHPLNHDWHDGHTDHYSEHQPISHNGSSEHIPEESLLDYSNYEEKIDNLIKEHGYKYYVAGGQYGLPDLANKNYNTGYLYVVDPTSEKKNWVEEAKTRSYRKIHELARALTWPEVNHIYGEGRRTGTLSESEAQRIAYWEHLALIKQRQLSEAIGYSIPDDSFNKEYRIVMADVFRRLGVEPYEIRTLIKSRPGFAFPKLGLGDDRRETPIVTTPKQLESKKATIVNAAMIDQDEPPINPERLNQVRAKIKQSINSMAQVASGVTSTHRSGTTTSYALGDALKPEHAGEHDPAAAFTQLHENFHLMMNRVRDKFGDKARNSLALNMIFALPKKHRLNMSKYIISAGYKAGTHEEALANLVNYLNDPKERDRFHAKMKHTPEQRRDFENSMKEAHRSLTAISEIANEKWLKPMPHLLSKSEDYNFNLSDSVFEDWEVEAAHNQMGHHPELDAAMSAASFMTGNKPVDEEALHMAMIAFDGDVKRAALYAYGIPDTEANIKTVSSLMTIKDVSKAEGFFFESIIPATADAEDVAQEVRRGVESGNVHHLKLAGKHSAGSMAVREPKTGKVWLLKSGVGKQSPAAGINEESASQSAREAAFCHVAKIWGFDHTLPRAELLLINAQEWAAIKMFAPTFKSLDRANKAVPGYAIEVLEPYRQNGILFKWAFLDYVLGNVDRHGNNVLVGDGGQVALIDHGSTFAGWNFSPGTDEKSFIPFYLRAFSSRKLKQLPRNQRVAALPTLNHERDAELRAFIDSIDVMAVATILEQYGIDPRPTVDRIQKIKDSTGPAYLAINNMWVWNLPAGG